MDEKQPTREEQTRYYQRYQRLVESNIVGLVIADAKGGILEANDYYLNILGFTREEFNAGKVSWKDCTPAEWLAADEKAIAELRQQGRCTPYEKEYIRKDGSRAVVFICDALLHGAQEHILAIVLDISERKKTESSLVRLQKKYQELVDNVNSIILQYDEQGKITFFNEYAQRFFGYREDEIIGKDVMTIVPEEESNGRDLKSLPDDILVRPQDFGENINENIKKNGDRVWVSWRNSPIKDAAGKVIGNLAVGQDITAQRKIQGQLEESELRLSELFDHMPICAAMYEAVDNGNDFIFKDFNKSGEYVEKISKEHLIGKRVTECFPGVKEFGLLDVLQRVWSSGKSESFEGRYYQDTRVSGWKNNYVYKLPSGEIVAIYEDITERKQAEEALRNNQAQLSNAMKLANLGHWEYEVKSDRFIFNDSFYTIFRTSAEQVGGYTMSSAAYANRFVHPDDRYMVAEETRHALETKDPQYTRQLEHRIIFADGKTGYITVRFYIEKDDKGQTIKTRGVNQDITERKLIEEKLNLALQAEIKNREIVTSMLEDNNLIREKLEKNLEELKQTQAMLVQSAKMASIGQLAGGVAHEINNPLTGVINNIQLIKMEAQAGKFNFDDFKELLGIIEESAFRCKTITQSLLDFSHVSRGTSVAVSLNEIVKGILTLVAHELKLENVNIVEMLDSALPMVAGDPQLLQQVIMNLVVNSHWAIQKQHGKSGGTITIKTWREGSSVDISISDNGIGIDQTHISRIFDPFFTTKEVGKGTGLGLALVYNIIQSHKGTIRVESQPGKGAAFTITLPSL